MTHNPSLTYDDYDTAAGVCVDAHRYEMIDIFEDVPNQNVVATLVDLVEHEATTGIEFYPSGNDDSLLQLYVTPAKRAEVDVLAHGAGFATHDAVEVDPATLYVTYTLAPEVWKTAPEAFDPAAALDEALEGFKRATFAGEGEEEGE